MKTWEVVYTEQAEHDLREIYVYIAFSLLEPETAKKQARRIIDSISKLNQIPLRYQPYEKEPWHSKGLRALAVDHYLVFYLPVEEQKTVVVVRIMYSGRNIEEHLSRSVTDS
jgi:toxin ParE1/3/4